MLHGDPPRSVPSSWGTSLSGALGRVTLFSERSERSRFPGTEAQPTTPRFPAGHLELLSVIPHNFEL